MLTDSPEWRPLRDAPAIIGEACSLLGPELHAGFDALCVALASGKVRVRAMSFSSLIVRPIERDLQNAPAIDPRPFANEIALGGAKIAFWNVEIDRVTLSRFVTADLAPAAPKAEVRNSTPMALVELHDPPGPKSRKDEIVAVLDQISSDGEGSESAMADHREVMRRLGNPQGRGYSYKTFWRVRAAWLADRERSQIL
jgi:hypothetical protein